MSTLMIDVTDNPQLGRMTLHTTISRVGSYLPALISAQYLQCKNLLMFISQITSGLE